MGVLGPDEPRYAAIGRAMAHTGDLVTPRLWGSPWFEKPPLLYWMTALGTVAGLNPELSGRLPVALLSLAFLTVFFLLIRREFGFTPAAVSTALLATSAGWLSYSQLCLTDLPLAVFFSLAVLLALPLLRANPVDPHRGLRFLVIGICIGIATLAKGLVPVALAVPFVWFLRRHWRTWWVAVAGCLAAALPWYVAVYLRNGYPFIQELFIKHHFERLYSASLQHVQPWYYYVPVLLAAVFPWTPLFALLAVREARGSAPKDLRRPFLGAIVIFGFVLFSVTLNKLPGYLLPLVPSLFALLGARFEFRRVLDLSRWWLVACALLIATIPLLASILPESLSTGRFSAAALKHVGRAEWFYIAAPIIVVFVARRSWAGLLLVLCVVSGAIYIKDRAEPVLDRRVSARVLWSRIRPLSDVICDNFADRDWIYGLSFYRGALIPPCTSGKFAYALEPNGRRPPVLAKLK